MTHVTCMSGPGIGTSHSVPAAYQCVYQQDHFEWNHISVQLEDDNVGVTCW